MKRTSILIATACTFGMATAANSAPICADALVEDNLERRYQRIAPIHNDASTGWVFGSDQLSHDYAISAEEVELLQHIVAEFSQHGSQLAIVVAPPRPVVAGQDVVAMTTGDQSVFDLGAQADDFNRLMSQLSETGALAPNLLSLVMSDPNIRENFYFSRDTHWTNTGAAHSALALSSLLVTDSAPRFVVSDLPSGENHDERGSLADVLRATCDVEIDDEVSPIFDYAAVRGDSVDLLSDEPSGAGTVALLGTSFSNRYKRDAYQFADALATALDRNVVNHSISGGGLVGPIETYILTGGLASDRPELTVWEFPYTYEFSEAALRQVLGALRADPSLPVAATLVANDRKAEFVMLGGTQPDLVGFRIADYTGTDLIVRVRFADGSSDRLRLVRKASMQEIAYFDTWWVDLGTAQGQNIISLEIEVREDVETIDVLLGVVGES